MLAHALAFAHARRRPAVATQIRDFEGKEASAGARGENAEFLRRGNGTREFLEAVSSPGRLLAGVTGGRPRHPHVVLSSQSHGSI